MKKTLLILTIFSTLCHADFFKDIVAPQELTKQEICYQYLPKISTTNPDLSCIKTKDKNSGSLTEPFLAILESIFLPTLFVEMQYDESTTKRAAQIFPFVYAQARDAHQLQVAKTTFKNAKNVQIFDVSTSKPDFITKSSKEKTVYYFHEDSSSIEKSIKNSPQNTIIMIDDQPLLNEIAKKVHAITSSYHYAYVYDHLIAYPIQENITVSPLIRALTMSRLYDGANYDINDVIQAELTIAHAQGKEKDALIEFGENPQKTLAPTHHELWHGLILIANDEYEKALTHFHEVKKLGLKDWRIDWYIAMAEAQCFFDIR